MVKKRISYITATVIYIIFIVSGMHHNEIYRFDCLYYGVEHSGNQLKYGLTLLLFSIIVFYCFGETERYIKGYGIFLLMRYRKRSQIIWKIVWQQAYRSLEVTITGQLLFVIACTAAFHRIPETEIRITIIYSILFYLVILNLGLFLSIIEIMTDSRIACLVTLGWILVSLHLSDIIYMLNMNSKWNILLYPNLALLARWKDVTVITCIRIIVLLVLCLTHILLLHKIFEKRDILSKY